MTGAMRNPGAGGSDADSVIRGKLRIAEASISFYEHDIVIPCKFEIFFRIIKVSGSISIDTTRPFSPTISRASAVP